MQRQVQAKGDIVFHTGEAFGSSRAMVLAKAGAILDVQHEGEDGILLVKQPNSGVPFTIFKDQYTCIT